MLSLYVNKSNEYCTLKYKIQFQKYFLAFFKVYLNVNFLKSFIHFLSSALSLFLEEVMSSLPLQMCLYFNVNYSALWILIRIGCLIYKVSLLLL